LKYEKPFGSTNRLDVPTRVRPQLADPSVPLWFTEGARKVDAAVSVGIACVGLAGVYGWRQTDPETKGKIALGDFDSVALNGREIIVAFDSDVMTKPDVGKALQRLRVFLQSREARTLVCTLPGENGKVGLDDYLAAGGTREALESLVVPVVRGGGGGGPITPPDTPAQVHTPRPNRPRSLMRKGFSTVSSGRSGCAASWGRNATLQRST
jgi:hypothetical protein